jgi:hypothetical protein
MQPGAASIPREIAERPQRLEERRGVERQFGLVDQPITATGMIGVFAARPIWLSTRRIGRWPRRASRLSVSSLSSASAEYSRETPLLALRKLGQNGVSLCYCSQ